MRCGAPLLPQAWQSCAAEVVLAGSGQGCITVFAFLHLFFVGLSLGMHNRMADRQYL
jgi:hypothetical protein